VNCERPRAVLAVGQFDFAVALHRRFASQGVGNQVGQGGAFDRLSHRLAQRRFLIELEQPGGGRVDQRQFFERAHGQDRLSKAMENGF
jgi:hypothetical protein